MSHSTYRILVADDEPEFRSLLRDWLQEQVREKLPGNYVVYEAEDGQKALEQVGVCKASGSSLDMAIIDLKMPGKNGFETIEDLLNTFPTTHVLVLSTTTSFFLDRLAGYGGRVTPVDKPIRQKEFVYAVTNILRSRGEHCA